MAGAEPARSRVLSMGRSSAPPELLSKRLVRLLETEANSTLSIVNGWHAARTCPVAAMGPQELLRMTPDEVLDRSRKATRIFLDVRVRVIATLNRNFVENLDSMTSPIGLAQQKDGNNRHLGDRDEPGKTTGCCRRFTEKRCEYRFTALRILIKRNTDQFARFQRLQHGPCGRVFSDHLNTGAFAHVRH